MKMVSIFIIYNKGTFLSSFFVSKIKKRALLSINSKARPPLVIPPRFL